MRKRLLGGAGKPSCNWKGVTGGVIAARGGEQKLAARRSKQLPAKSCGLMLIRQQRAQPVVHDLCAERLADEDCANRAFYRTFAVAPEATLGRSFCELGNRQWDIPVRRKLLTEIIPRNNVVEAFEVKRYPSG